MMCQVFHLLFSCHSSQASLFVVRPFSFRCHENMERHVRRLRHAEVFAEDGIVTTGVKTYAQHENEHGARTSTKQHGNASDSGQVPFRHLAKLKGCSQW